MSSFKLDGMRRWRVKADTASSGDNGLVEVHVVGDLNLKSGQRQEGSLEVSPGEIWAESGLREVSKDELR